MGLYKSFNFIVAVEQVDLFLLGRQRLPLSLRELFRRVEVGMSGNANDGSTDLLTCSKGMHTPILALFKNVRKGEAMGSLLNLQ